MLKLHNTLTRKIEDFVPLTPQKVGIYACGPTVYDYIHIGNLRSFIFYDILRNTLTANNYEVKFVQNITDIEDKIIKRAQEKNLTPKQLTEEYTKYFFQDLTKLNITMADVHPKATEHIGAMIKYIEELIKKGLAYTEADGSVYFDISEFPDYGKLSQIKKRELKTGTRVLSDEYNKEDAQDFALWKSVNPNEFGWDSPWGKGRPGWHIECSVMSQEYLGDTFDIHTGGIDLLFPHHENEIAQSEGKTGKQFVKYFVHGEHLLVDDKKMSKSLNNFFTLRDVEERGFDPMSFRYLILTARFDDKLNFTWESLQAAQNALNNLRTEIRNWKVEEGASLDEFAQIFMEDINDNLSTPKAMAVMWQVVKDPNLSNSQKAIDLLEMDKILGLKLDEYVGKRVEIPPEVQKLVNQREKARAEKDFKKSDELRNEIKKLGFEILDTSEGQKIKHT